MERSSGILLHISSLPSPHGIGTFGQAAYDFIDFLVSANQKYWQILPIGPTSFGNSPYQSFSTFAYNPFFIDLDYLAKEDLLNQEATFINWGINPSVVDFALLHKHRFEILFRAYTNAKKSTKHTKRLETFTLRHIDWLEDYALFMALKDHFDGQPWIHWPYEIRFRETAALETYTNQLADRINFYRFLQMLACEQWEALKSHANKNNIRIIGDLPIYVPLDSADVWANTSEFQLDNNRLPIAVAGVPPDYFTIDGQLWGNPLYDWNHMMENNYVWWLHRMEQAARLYDTLRFDHFRGLSSYWAIPFGAENSRVGSWIKGPGINFVRMICMNFPQLEIIVEDLGLLTADVADLVHESKLPNMKVLQFAFDSGEPNNHLPHTYESNCVCYTGTHDNTTVLGWFDKATAAERALATCYFGLHEAETISWGFIRGGMSSVAKLFIAPMQDYLNLGEEARMNLPGTVDNNWQWRLMPDFCNTILTNKIAAISRVYGR